MKGNLVILIFVLAAVVLALYQQPYAASLVLLLALLIVMVRPTKIIGRYTVRVEDRGDIFVAKCGDAWQRGDTLDHAVIRCLISIGALVIEDGTASKPKEEDVLA